MSVGKNRVFEMRKPGYYAPTDISISPKYRISHWKEAHGNNDWDQMAGIFIDRIEGRFLKPIRLIAKDVDIGEFSGFAILALDCLIIETLNQFHFGRNTTVGKHNKTFWVFFNNSDFFKDHFSKDQALIFYSHFRCGILHQAQTKEKSVVRIGQNTMIETVQNDNSKGLIVDRLKFHGALENAISSYIEKLRNGDEQNSKLRCNFVKKMNFICEIE